MEPQVVYPPRNLPGSADSWGRKVEHEQRVLSKTQTQDRQTMDNGLRSASGQLAVISGQMDSLVSQVSELSARSTHSDSPANIQLIIGSSSGSVGPASTPVSLPGPQIGSREAVIYGSGSVAWTGTTTTGIAEGVSVGIEFRQSGSRIWYTNSSASSSQMFAWQGSDTFSVVVPVTIPLGGSSFDVRMWVGKTSSGGQANAGARLENMKFSIVYGNLS